MIATQTTEAAAGAAPQARPAGPADPASFYDLARTALDAADGNVSEARRAIVKRLKEDVGLLDILVDDAIQIAASRVTSAVVTAERSAILRQAEIRAANRPAAVAALARGMARSIFDFPLAGGRRLGDATRDEVIEQANLYAAFAADQQRKANWLRAVASEFDPAAAHAGARVRDVMTERQVEALLGREG